MKKIRVIEKHDQRSVSKDELIDILMKQIESIKKSDNTYHLRTTRELEEWIDEGWNRGKDVAREITIRTEFDGN